MLAAAPGRKPTSRLLLTALREAEGPLTARELAALSGTNPHTAQIRLADWLGAGLIDATSLNPRLYVMTKVSSSLPGTMVRRSTARQAIWSAIRVMRKFDVPSVVRIADVSLKTVQVFLLDLQRAGYVKRIRNGQRRKGETSTFVLIDRFGPRAPSITTPRDADGRRRRVLIDNNDGTRHDVTEPASTRALG